MDGSSCADLTCAGAEPLSIDMTHGNASSLPGTLALAVCAVLLLYKALPCVHVEVWSRVLKLACLSRLASARKSAQCPRLHVVSAIPTSYLHIV